MSLQDPIADMLTCIRNAQLAEKYSVFMPSSQVKKAIASVLKEEGYIVDFSVEKKQAALMTLRVDLKYHQGKPVISELWRRSRPGLRVYTGKSDLPYIHGGLGIAIISTSKGIMSDHKAREMGYGGEVLCYVT